MNVTISRWIVILTLIIFFSNASASEYTNEEIINLFDNISMSKPDSLLAPSKKGVIKAQYVLFALLALDYSAKGVGADEKGANIEIYAWSKIFYDNFRDSGYLIIMSAMTETFSDSEYDRGENY